MKLLRLLAALAFGCVACSHAQPVPQKPRTYVISEDTRGVGSAPGIGGSGFNCDDEFNKCFKRCWESRNPPYPHKPDSEWYYEYCTRECRKAYTECIKEMEKEEAERAKRRTPLKFTSIDEALAWLRSHKSEIAIGTVVIVAGTAFVIATGGTGALLLTPMAL